VVETEVVAEAEPEPIAAATETHPEAASVSDDVIAQPTWQGVAPAAATSESVDPGSLELPAAATDAEPQWPTRPAWLSDSPNVGLPFLGRSSTPQGGLDALWAESNREVASPPSANKQAGVQPCVNCGLSLSATARFCRRCGTPQGS
jgi:ribosomal protein L40E